MVTKRIIPCLDIKNGRVVKGINFENLVDIGDPAQIAKKYEAQGADEIVLLDITATLENRKTFCDIVSSVAKVISIPITVGGGIRTIENIREVLKAGASKVSINSAAVKNPSLIKQASAEFGKEKIVVAIDGKGENVVISGGKEVTSMRILDWAQQCEQLGAGEILYTSMDTDGVQTGYDNTMTKAIVQAVKIPVIASGGCGSIADMMDVLKETDCAAALGASLFHFNKATVYDAKNELLKNGFAKIDGLIPAIVQDFYTGRVLMLAYVNQQSYEVIIKEGKTCFWSRSRKELWRKGETSNNYQIIRNMAFDCDYDTLLLQVEQTGDGACHTGRFSCFGTESGEFDILNGVYEQVKDRAINPKEKSYTNYLLNEGVNKICKKVGEESAEAIIAAIRNDNDELIGEISDLAYHLLVLMYVQGISPKDITEKLAQRHTVQGNLKKKNTKGSV